MSDLRVHRSVMRFRREGLELVSEGLPKEKERTHLFVLLGWEGQAVSCMRLLSEILLHRCLMKRDTAVLRQGLIM